MRSERGKTVEEPAVTISPDTASGAYMASGSSAGASVGAVVGSGAVVGASVAGGASVGSGACVVAGAHAASTKLVTMRANISVRTILIISTFSPLIFIQCHLISAVLRP